MSFEKELNERSDGQCELCSTQVDLQPYIVTPKSGDTLDEVVNACGNCQDQIENPDQVDANHWRCLNESMWSEVPAVQVVSWRMLTRLKPEGWPADLLDMMFLDDDVLAWAQSGSEEKPDDQVVHKDSVGAILSSGDGVVLIKDLDVKGANFTAKRGTAVKNISLVHDNPEQIEGKVNGQQIVILTKFVKKSS